MNGDGIWFARKRDFYSDTKWVPKRDDCQYFPQKCNIRFQIKCAKLIDIERVICYTDPVGCNRIQPADIGIHQLNDINYQIKTPLIKLRL